MEDVAHLHNLWLLLEIRMEVIVGLVATEVGTWMILLFGPMTVENGRRRGGEER